MKTKDGKIIHTSFIDAVLKNRPMLVRQAYRFLHNSSLAEDVAQDAVLTALLHLNDFRGDSRLKTWLYRVGVNTALMSLRKKQRIEKQTERAKIILPEDLDWLHGNLSKTLIPSNHLEEEEQSELIHWALEQIPESYRVVILRCDLAEQPIEDVAKSLGLTIGGIRTRRLRAHRMLKEVLNDGFLKYNFSMHPSIK